MLQSKLPNTKEPASGTAVGSKSNVVVPLAVPIVKLSIFASKLLPALAKPLVSRMPPMPGAASTIVT